jgi:hypothetical protein
MLKNKLAKIFVPNIQIRFKGYFGVSVESNKFLEYPI